MLSTLWAVPDGTTSVLMFMVHHYLRTQGLAPWDALRRAQLWLLDPGREIPDTMPRALRGEVEAVDIPDVRAWAGFVHGGQ